jgi:hypothetical protein
MSEKNSLDLFLTLLCIRNDALFKYAHMVIMNE